MSPEQKIQKQITDYLYSIGAYQVKVISATKKGVPDILVCLRGQFVGIEVKTPKTLKTLSVLQKYNLKQIDAAGGVAFVASSVSEVKAQLKPYLFTVQN